MNRLKRKYAILFFAFLLLVQVTLLGVLFTQGRYEEELSSDSDIYDGDMEYIVSEQVEVSSVEELIAAIVNGYSNIKVSDEVDNPLIITSGVTDVGVDLILDLNGHEIQRNNREPMLNIVNGVRMTVIDTSMRQTGSMYNPVGSVLQVGGGTLTVAAGDFVSGPKKSEYAHPENGVWTAASSVKSSNGLFTLGGEGGTLKGTVPVTLYTKDGGSYTEKVGVDMPVIEPYVAETQYTFGSGEKYWFVNGNMYFDKGCGFDLDYGGVMKEDTYLYHVLSDKSVGGSTIAVSGSADFYYTYHVERSTDGNGKPSYTYTDTESGENIFTVTVYGYNGVKESAKSPETQYATVRMMSGNMYVRGGTYAANFGEATSYGVYASGGYMAVEAGAFDALENAVCIECAYLNPEESEYLRVSGGTFSSDDGDTIRVSKGNMVVTGGEFAKNDAVPNDTTSAIIRVSGGELEVSGSAAQKIQFTLTGSNQHGIHAAGGSVNIENAVFTFPKVNGEGTGSQNVGVFTESGESAVKDVSLKNINISIYGDNGRGNYGVSAKSDVSLSGNCVIEVHGSSSGGLLAQGGDITYTGVDEEILDIYLVMPDKTTDIDSTAMAALGGSITMNGTVDVFSNGLGVAVWNDPNASAAGTNKVSLESGTLTIKSTRASALYVSGGNVDFAARTKVTITSSADPACRVGENGPAMFDGVYVQNGSLTANGTLKVDHTGVENTENQGNYSASERYRNYKINSFAVRVESGSESDNVTILHGEITNDCGGGLYVAGGSVILDDKPNDDNTINDDTMVNIKTLGTEMYATWWEQQSYGDNWNYKLTKKGGPAVEVSGGTLTINDGIYSAAQGEGILVRDGTADIWGGTFVGNDNKDYKSQNGENLAGPAASYAFKMYGGTANIYGGSFGKGSLGSGAFVMGTAADKAYANVYGGTFEVNGQAGFSVFEYVNVKFNPYGGENGAGDKITVKGSQAGMTIEYRGAGNSSVEIFDGEFIGEGDPDFSNGIWYSESKTKLIIRKGTFKGSKTSGLYFNVEPGEGNVQLSGGTFIGNTPNFVEKTPWWGSNGGDSYWENGAISAWGSLQGNDLTGYRYNGCEIDYADIIPKDIIPDKTVYYGKTIEEAIAQTYSFKIGTVHDDFAQREVIYIA